MFYKLMYKRSLHKYKKSYFNILCVFIVSLSMLSFISIFCDSWYNYDDAVLIPLRTADHTCDIRVKNITEEDANDYIGIQGVDAAYINGNLDFFLTEPENFETILKQIQNVFLDVTAQKYYGIYYDFTEPGAPSINVYYGLNPRDMIDDSFGMKIMMSIFQAILTVIAVIAMVAIYKDYIDARKEDIQILYAVGTTERQLERLFSGECNLLYLISVVVGIPLGGLIVYLLCVFCKVVDMSGTNQVYPVFCLNMKTLLLIALMGFIAVNIAFRFVLNQILRIDASYAGANNAVEFKPDKFRDAYWKADPHFSKFFSKIMRKRTSSKSKMLTAVTAFIIAVAVLMLSIVNYLAVEANIIDTPDSIANADGYLSTIRNFNGEPEITDYAALFSTSGLFMMVMLFAIIFNLFIIYIFTKKHMEANAHAVQLLYTIGATENVIYASYRRFTLQNVRFTGFLGLILGYAAAWAFFGAENTVFPITVWLVLAVAVLMAAYFLIYMLSMKKNFSKSCRDTIGSGGNYGTD